MKVLIPNTDSMNLFVATLAATMFATDDNGSVQIDLTVTNKKDLIVVAVFNKEIFTFNVVKTDDNKFNNYSNQYLPVCIIAKAVIKNILDIETSLVFTRELKSVFDKVDKTFKLEESDEGIHYMSNLIEEAIENTHKIMTSDKDVEKDVSKAHEELKKSINKINNILKNC